MSAKGYKDRVNLGLLRLKEDLEIQDPLFDLVSAAADVGEIFQLVADSLDDLGENSIGQAFSDSGLNPQSPFHWGYLLQLFAEAHYGGGKEGRPKTRTSQYRRIFKRRLKELQKKHSDEPRSKIFEKFALEFGGRAPFQTLKTEDGVKTAYYEMKKPLSRKPSAKRK
jgi:hypothetical protein